MQAPFIINSDFNIGVNTFHNRAIVTGLLQDLSSFSLSTAGRFTATSILPTRRGSLKHMLGYISLGIGYIHIHILAFIAMVVSMQVANETHNKSVGENFSPLPRLSVGASVSIIVLLRVCSSLATQISRIYY